MGIFDIFSDQPAKDAAQAQIAGLNSGYSLASGDINQGIGALQTNYTKALQPYLQNYGTAQGGVGQLTNLLGITAPSAGTVGSSPTGAPVSSGGGGVGPSVPSSILQALQATPGYQFQLEQGDNAINAQAAATGMNASGNQALALSKFNQGLAGTTYQQAVQNLMPFLNASNAAAGGIANVDTGLGNATANQYNQLGQLGYATQTGIGNANANADLARYNASGNIWNAIGGIGGMKTAGGGSVGGNAVSGIGSALMSFLPMLSDERLKEDVDQVGELFDGQPVYKYRYIGDNVFRIGLMAQDVEKTHPEAVVEIGGYKAVRYDKATRYAADLARFLEAA